MVNKEIAIPTDNDGFILLKCNLCGEYFKLKPHEMETEDVIDIWCPTCGLTSDSYLTEDVIELALKMARNLASEMLFDAMKDWERKSKGGFISFKAGRKPTEEVESPIISWVEALEIEKYRCCKKQAKIKPLIKMVGSYCPYCGVKYDEFK